MKASPAPRLGRGGARPGAGRPAHPERRKAKAGVCLTPEQLTFVSQLATSRGMSPSEVMRAIIEDARRNAVHPFAPPMGA